MAQTRILRSLYLLITEKQEDDELVLQILFALYRFLQVRGSRGRGKGEEVLRPLPLPAGRTPYP